MNLPRLKNPFTPTITETGQKRYIRAFSKENQLELKRKQPHSHLELGSLQFSTAITIIRGAFNKFPDFFCTDIYNFRWLSKIQYIIVIHRMRWLTNFYDFRLKWTATAAIGIHPTKAWLSQLVNFKNAIWTSEERYAIKFCFKLGKNTMRWKLDLLLWPREQETEFPVEACWLSQIQEDQTEKIHPQTSDDPFFWHAHGSER